MALANNPTSVLSFFTTIVRILPQYTDTDFPPTQLSVRRRSSGRTDPGDSHPSLHRFVLMLLRQKIDTAYICVLFFRAIGFVCQDEKIASQKEIL